MKSSAPIKPYNKEEVMSAQENFEGGSSISMIVRDDYEVVQKMKQRPLLKLAYDPAAGPAMLSWFNDKPKNKTIADTFVYKNGELGEKYREVALPPPQFSDFARTIGTTGTQLRKWAKENKEFAEYYDACVDIIQEFFVENGVLGKYSGQFATFAAKNLTKMKDVQVNENRNYDMKAVLDALQNGNDPYKTEE